MTNFDNDDQAADDSDDTDRIRDAADEDSSRSCGRSSAGSTRYRRRWWPPPAAGFIWRTIDAELAQLTSDSVLDADRMAAVRGVADARAAHLRAGRPHGGGGDRPTAVDGLRLLGQLVPAQRGQVEIRHGGGTTTVDADDLGRFTASGVQPGPVSLRCRTEAGGLRRRHRLVPRPVAVRVSAADVSRKSSPRRIKPPSPRLSE